MSTGWDENGFISNHHQRSFWSCTEIINFFIIKFIFAIKESFVVPLYRNNLATITVLTGKSYLPVQKIDMFVDIEVKVRELVAETSRLFSAP